MAACATELNTEERLGVCPVFLLSGSAAEWSSMKGG